MGSVRIDGSKIKFLREQQDLTQLYLATAVGVTTDTISRWENKRYPTIKRENGEKLAEALDVTLEELLENVEVEEELEKGQTEQEPLVHADTSVVRRFFPVKKAGIVLLVAGLLLVIGLLLLPPKTILITCARIMPEHAAPNTPFPVIIRIEADTDQEVPILIREELIGEGQASGRGAAGEIKVFGKNPRWIGTLNNGHAQFTYLVIPDKNSKGKASLSFSGEIRTRKGRKTSSAVDGPTTIDIVPYHWADADRDYRISDTEILMAYETYSSPGETGIDFSFTEELWLAGKYTWSETNTSFEIEKTSLPRE